MTKGREERKENALAGEEFKTRTVDYAVKVKPIEVGDEEGHAMSVVENKGILSNMEGKAFGDGWVVRAVSLYDWNVKTIMGSGHSYMEAIDRDGDKCYYQSDIEREKGKSYTEGKLTIPKGTGKYEGVKGGATWRGYYVVPQQAYLDQDWEVELPGR